MENFFNYITKPIKPDDVELWLSANNIIIEKVELFGDFCVTLTILISDTYLGDDELRGETKIKLNEEENTQHFNWCWFKTIEIFNLENIIFNNEGGHYDYFQSFFNEMFYNQKENKLKTSITDFFEELFDLEKPFTKSDLDMLTNIYKLLDNNIEK
jgi:hypothetical protein